MSTNLTAESAAGRPLRPLPSGMTPRPGTAPSSPANGASGTPSSSGDAQETSRATRARGHGSTSEPAAVPIMSRRSQPKSRSGCRTCKSRKIKCDEHKPQCRNCMKHTVTCDFIRPRPVDSSRSSASPRATSASLNPENRSGGGPGAPLPNDLNMSDLELLHNFTTSTYATLSSNTAVRQVLRTNAVRMALKCDYVMRTLLAVSALHLAHYRTNMADFYVGKALQHHQIASQAVIPIMSDLSYENCENLHLFSLLTLFFAMGCPKRDTGSLIIGDTVLPHWLFLLRGVEPVIRVLDPENYTGPLKAIFTYGAERWRAVFDHKAVADSAILADLQASINKACSGNPELLDIYNRTIAHLRNVLCLLFPTMGNDNERVDRMTGILMQGPTCLEASDIFVWKWTAAKDFLPLIQGPDAKQEAIAIFAHFLILLKKLESQWWLEGWATFLLERVWTMLDQEHRLWIQWPIEEIGWVPP